VKTKPARKRNRRWQLQEAKNKFSEVVRRAVDEGPQTITVHGKDTVVLSAVLPRGKRASRAGPKKPANLLELLRPLRGLNLKTERDDAPAREVSFEEDADA